MLENALKELKLLLDNIQSFIDRRKLIPALVEVESGGNDWAVGDTHLTNKAYGPLQIRKPYVDDINAYFGTDYYPTDCLGDRKLSIWMFERYMDIYATEKRLGRKPTMEDMARIHNGGPNGYKNPLTSPYWTKVRKILWKS